MQAPAREFRAHASRNGAIGRDQRRGLYRRLQRLAQTDRDGERFLALVGGFDQADVGERILALASMRDDIGSPVWRRLARRQGLRDETPPFVQHCVRRGERAHILARNFEARQQPRERGLRMAVRRLGYLPRAGRQPPVLFRHDVVEARQDHGAARHACDGAHEFRGRAVRAGRAEHDRRFVHLGEPRRLAIDQSRAPRGEIDRAAISENIRPEFDRDLQEFRGNAPVAIVIFSRKTPDRRPVRAFDDEFVDEIGKFSGERKRVSR
ncbi:MAG: hypothetical protein KDJ40_22060, partial [Hyphomicrobiales bacterium]|nr:hypothetical protein [Hyphomicrobiales bacterium]